MLAAPASGQIGSIDNNFPITIDDSGVSKLGEGEIEAVLLYDRARSRATRDRRNDFSPQLGFEYGVLPGLELSFEVSYGLGTSGSADKGSLSGEAKYRLNEETVLVPSLALDLGVSVPYGFGGDAVDAELMLLASKALSSDEWALRLHANVGWVHRFDAGSDERKNRYLIAVGASKLIANDWAVAADLVREQREEKRSASNLMEAGIRYGISDAVVLSVGAGLGIGEESPVYRGLIGLQYNF